MSPRGDHPEFDFEGGEILLFDKPSGWTSFDVVAKVRSAIRVRKVGHAGTLDPLATGLLILATGKATRRLAGFTDMDKAYTGRLRLGQTTPSYDAETEPTEAVDVLGIGREQVEGAMARWKGEIRQLSPAYSAVKVGGRRLYKAARKGETVERPARLVRVDAFELTSFEPPDAAFRVVCSKGTYVRSLVHDLGAALGVGAWMTELRRTRIGPHRVEDAWTLPGFLETVNLVRRSRPAPDDPRDGDPGS